MANGLESYIDEKAHKSNQFLDNNQVLENLEFITWQRLNQLVMSWIYATLTAEPLGHIVGFSSVFEI